MVNLNENTDFSMMMMMAKMMAMMMAMAIFLLQLLEASQFLERGQ